MEMEGVDGIMVEWNHHHGWNGMDGVNHQWNGMDGISGIHSR